jgi:hypothetical protein
LVPGRERLTYVRATVEVRQHLDGTLSIWYGDRELAWRPAPPDARALRGRGQVPPAGPAPVPPAGRSRKPGPDHPWRRPLKPQAATDAQAQGVTFSRTSSG